MHTVSYNIIFTNRLYHITGLAYISELVLIEGIGMHG